MIDDIEKAYTLYKEASAMELEMVSSEPIIGMIRCLILKGELEEAECQLRFLNEICDTDVILFPLKIIIKKIYKARTFST